MRVRRSRVRASLITSALKQFDLSGANVWAVLQTLSDGVRDLGSQLSFYGQAFLYKRQLKDLRAVDFDRICKHQPSIEREEVILGRDMIISIQRMASWFV